MTDRQMVVCKSFDTVEATVDWLNSLYGNFLNSIEIVVSIDHFQIIDRGNTLFVVALVSTTTEIKRQSNC